MKHLISPSISIAVVILCSNFVGIALGVQAETGLAELRRTVGESNVNGSGVDLLQVEADRVQRDVNDLDNDGDTTEIIARFYAPDTTNGQFAGKTFQDLGNPQGDGPSTHATFVGVDLYGIGVGTARGIGGPNPNGAAPPISITSFNNFLNDDLVNNGFTPRVQTHDVSNHSYTLDLNPQFSQSDAENVLQRLDYSINEGNTTTVVGSSNSRDEALPAGLVQAYNTINVGVTDRTHGSGPTTINGIGRSSIHLVTDETTTSGATAVISGFAAILHQTGRGTDAVRQEVIKATLLAGATKDVFSGDWNRTPTQPLDLEVGAGQANILNSYRIQNAGEINGTTEIGGNITTDFNGWEYDANLLAGDERFYEFVVADDELIEELSIALTWNLNVVDSNPSPFFFTPSTELADLSLELFDSSNTLVDFSDSPVDNLEHIYFENLASGTYRLRVSNNSPDGVNTDFGLAFRSTVVPVATSVPEPSSTALAALIAGVLITRRRKTPF